MSFGNQRGIENTDTHTLADQIIGLHGAGFDLRYQVQALPLQGLLDGMTQVSSAAVKYQNFSSQVVDVYLLLSSQSTILTNDAAILDLLEWNDFKRFIDFAAVDKADIERADFDIADDL